MRPRHWVAGLALVVIGGILSYILIGSPREITEAIEGQSVPPTKENADNAQRHQDALNRLPPKL